MKFFLAALSLVAVEAAEPAGPIKHIVLLMQENRAFDHMCGFFPGVDGLTGKESNPKDTTDPHSDVVYVNNTSPYMGSFDPSHGTGPTTQKIFGKAGEAEQKEPKMDGFYEYEYAHHGDVASEVMNMFTPDRVPITKALADEFVLFDRFFCSHPGPTWPNRLFQLLGTSAGCTETSETHKGLNPLYGGKTIFDSVKEAGFDWRFYYADAPLELAVVRGVAAHPGKVKGWKQFHKDIAEGALPAFSWVNPRWFANTTTGQGANDDHPDHDVRLGQELMKEVYEALRASPKWNETLFIVTYDEHGGYYDHVPTPMNVPAPDDTPAQKGGFDYTRLGVRIPVLAISPWLPKGHVEGRAQGPESNSEYDATSILSTTKDLLGLEGFLTKRDAWAGSFSHLFSLQEPRTDCPMTLPEAPQFPLGGMAQALQEAAHPINGLQRRMIDSFAFHAKMDASHLKTQGEAGEWVAARAQELLAGQHGFGAYAEEVGQAV